MRSPDATSVWTTRLPGRALAYKWACLRVLVQAYVIFCIVSVFGGLLTYPLVSWLFLAEPRFWRHLRLAPRLYWFLLRCTGLFMRGQGEGFLLSVPLTDPPALEPDLSLVKLNPAWALGSSCGKCTHCCDRIGCPIADRQAGCCLGYGSIYWRYFNCGRFPTSQAQLEFYKCPKWLMR